MVRLFLLITYYSLLFISDDHVYCRHCRNIHVSINCLIWTTIRYAHYRMEQFTVWSFQIFHPSLPTCYITTMVLTADAKNNWAVKRIYLESYFVAESFTFVSICGIFGGALAPMETPHGSLALVLDDK